MSEKLSEMSLLMPVFQEFEQRCNVTAYSSTSKHLSVGRSSIKMSAKSQPVPAPADIQAQYNRYKNELQAIASKIGELENDIEEHE